MEKYTLDLLLILIFIVLAFLFWIFVSWLNKLKKAEIKKPKIKKINPLEEQFLEFKENPITLLIALAMFPLMIVALYIQTFHYLKGGVSWEK